MRGDAGEPHQLAGTQEDSARATRSADVDADFPYDLGSDEDDRDHDEVAHVRVR